MVVITLKLILTAIFIYGLHADITMIAVASVISQCFLFVMALRNLGSESEGIVMGVRNSLTALFSSIVAFFVVRGIKKRLGGIRHESADGWKSDGWKSDGFYVFCLDEDRIIVADELASAGRL